MRRTRLLVLLACLAWTAPLGCEGPASKTALGYTADAKRAYEAAMEEFTAHNWLEA